MKSCQPKTNYFALTEKIVSDIKDLQNPPSLLLHCCCAPCASACLSYLAPYFDITVYFFNPNIFPPEEYQKRLEELKRLIQIFPSCRPIKILEANYCPDDFFFIAKGLENLPEGQERCHKCFDLRLNKTAQIANENGFDYFATTLTISPLKDEQLLNAIGFAAAEGKTAKWLPSDFKKKDGYRKSVELSSLYNLYRQNFCGCIYSAAASKKYTIFCFYFIFSIII